MTIEDIKYFQTKEGLDLIEKYKHLSDDDLEMLAFSLVKKHTPHYAYLITLLKLRKKAQSKFSKADQMFFDSQSLEMATSEKIANHIAERFENMKKIVDLTCGIGGNTLSLAKKSKVVAVDFEKTSLEMARINAKVYGISENIEFREGNAFFNIDRDADAFFLDPMRAREGESKTRSFLNSQPRISEILPRLFKVSKNVCIKVSPAFDYKEIDLLPEKPEIELVSENNENKVALLWFGAFRKNKRKATMFFADKKIEILDKEKKIEIPILDKFQKYVYEPNVAIIKAHLLDEVADENGLSKINKNIAFLTNNSLKNVDKRKFRTFEIIKFAPFSFKNLRKDLAGLEAKYITIVNRGTPILSEKLLKDLKLKEGVGPVILLTKLKDEKNYYVITKKV